MGYAYRQALAGDVVVMAAGTYLHSSATLLARDPSKGAERVTFRPAAGASVTVDLNRDSPDIEGVEHVLIEGISFVNGGIGIVPANRSGCGPNSNDVTIQNSTVRGPISIRNGQNLLIKNVRIGPFNYTDPWGDSSRVGNYPGCGTGRGQIATNVTWDNVTWAGIRRNGSPSHAECLFLEASYDVTVKNSRLDTCPVIGVLIKNDNVGQNVQHGLTFENNFISAPGDGGSFAIQEANCDNAPSVDPSNWTIRFNSLQGTLLLCLAANYWDSSNHKLYGNVGTHLVGNNTCHNNNKPTNLNNWTISHNIWAATGETCHPTDKTSPLTNEWINPNNLDYHLKPTAQAINHVPTTQGCPNTDIDNHTRVIINACDAGADEFGSVGSPPPPPSDTTRPLVRPAARASITSRTVRVPARGLVRAKVACRGVVACRGTARLVARLPLGKAKAKPITIGTGRMWIAAGKPGTVKIQLTKRGLAAVRKHRTMRAELVLRLVSSRGFLTVKRAIRLTANR